MVRVASSFSDMQNVTVDFKIMQGGTLVDEGTQTAGVRPGGGVVYADFLVPKAGKAGVRYTVKAGIQSLAPGFADDALAAAKIVGRPKFIRDTPTCGMSARVRNASRKVLSESTEIYLVGLRMGKIVAFGPAGLFDDLAPGATKAIEIDSTTCTKVDQVRAYVEGTRRSAWTASSRPCPGPASPPREGAARREPTRVSCRDPGRRRRTRRPSCS